MSAAEGARGPVRVAVVGHVEWAECVEVHHVPKPGEIVHADPAWEAAAGGGAVAAVQLARLAGECLFITAIGDDELGHRARSGLEPLGVRIEAAWRDEPQRRALVQLDAQGERTITVIGERMGPLGNDPLPWAELANADGVYFTAGDATAARAARRAKKLVASVRAMEPLLDAAIEVDVLVSSASDPGETYRAGDLDPPPRAVVRTAGAAGGSVTVAAAAPVKWTAAALNGPILDSYGAGDSFAAGLTYGLAAGLDLPAAINLGARCGAASMAVRGPYADLR